MAAGEAERPGEFALIEHYFRPLATDPGAWGLRDDAAELSPGAGEDLVLTTDLIAEGIHFFKDDPPAAIARKALRVNLSDLAAKGAMPVGYLMAIALPRDWTEEWIAPFAAALAEDQERYGISLFGGDTSRASGGLTISITAIGKLPRGTMVHREGARPGDEVFVSGTIGDAALGLRLRLGTIDAEAAAAGGTQYLLDRYLVPEPRVALAPVIREYATSALDISDGLVGDFRHICTTSGVGGELEAARVPLSPAAAALVAAEPTALATVLTGGDDYEILATVSPEQSARFAAAARAVGVQVTRIGQVDGEKNGPVVRDADGRPLPLGRLSHTHF